MSLAAGLLRAGRAPHVRIVGAVSAAHFVSHYYIMLLAPLLPFVRAEYGVSYTEIGFAFAAFNIISSLIMLVKDKGADIAVLRTMGATRGAIMRIFSITGTAIGVIGTLVGTVIGLIVAANAEALRASISNLLGVTLFPPEVFFLSSLPSRTDPMEVTVVVCMALGLSFLATLYPAWRAAQYDPVEALRYE